MDHVSSSTRIIPFLGRPTGGFPVMWFQSCFKGILFYRDHLVAKNLSRGLCIQALNLEKKLQHIVDLETQYCTIQRKY